MNLNNQIENKGGKRKDANAERRKGKKYEVKKKKKKNIVVTCKYQRKARR